MSRQSEIANRMAEARVELKKLLPYRSTVYYTITSSSRSGDTIHVQFLVPVNGPRVASLRNITTLLADFTGTIGDPAHPGTLKLVYGGYTPAGLIRHIGRLLHGDLSQGVIKKGHAEHEWLYAKDTLAL